MRVPSLHFLSDWILFHRTDSFYAATQIVWSDQRKLVKRWFWRSAKSFQSASECRELARTSNRMGCPQHLHCHPRPLSVPCLYLLWTPVARLLFAIDHLVLILFTIFVFCIPWLARSCLVCKIKQTPNNSTHNKYQTRVKQKICIQCVTIFTILRLIPTTLDSLFADRCQCRWFKCILQIRAWDTKSAWKMKLWDIDLVTFALAVISVWPQNHSCLPASPFCPYPRAIFPPSFFSFRFTPSQSCLRCPPNSSSTACATFDLTTTFHVASNDCRWLLFAADSKFSLGFFFFLSACYALSLSVFLFPPHPAQISKQDDINKNICYRPFFFSFIFPWFSSWDVFSLASRCTNLWF